jgi:hypothetical protein
MLKTMIITLAARNRPVIEAIAVHDDLRTCRIKTVAKVRNLEEEKQMSSKDQQRQKPARKPHGGWLSEDNDNAHLIHAIGELVDGKAINYNLAKVKTGFGKIHQNGTKYRG